MGAASYSTTMTAPFHTVFLGLGSNLGDRRANLQRAIQLLSEQLEVRAVSSLYETEPVGYLDQPKFLNAVCRATTALRPEALLAHVKAVEAALGRMPTVRFGPRIIDIDILLYDDLVLDTPTLTIPHPRLTERAFVLAPLSELAPAAVHPLLEMMIHDLYQRVGGKDSVQKVNESAWYKPAASG